MMFFLVIIILISFTYNYLSLITKTYNRTCTISLRSKTLNSQFCVRIADSIFNCHNDNDNNIIITRTSAGPRWFARRSKEHVKVFVEIVMDCVTLGQPISVLQWNSFIFVIGLFKIHQSVTVRRRTTLYTQRESTSSIVLHVLPLYVQLHAGA